MTPPGYIEIEPPLGSVKYAPVARVDICIQRPSRCTLSCKVEHGHASRPTPGSVTRRRTPGGDVRALGIYTRGVFAAVALLALAILAHNALHFSAYVGHPSSMIVRFVSPLIVSGLMSIALWLPLDLRLVIANVICAAVVSLYLGEFYLAWKLEHTQQSAA